MYLIFSVFLEFRARHKIKVSVALWYKRNYSRSKPERPSYYCKTNILKIKITSASGLLQNTVLLKYIDSKVT
jgi:hypothetical protein